MTQLHFPLPLVAEVHEDGDAPGFFAAHKAGEGRSGPGEAGRCPLRSWDLQSQEGCSHLGQIMIFVIKRRLWLLSGENRWEGDGTCGT